MGNLYKDSDNIDELLSSYIDNEIKEAFKRTEISNLIKRDPIINKKYRSELITKDLLHSRIGMVSVPAETVSRVNKSIENLIKRSSPVIHTQATTTFFSELRNILIKPLYRSSPVPRYAFVMGMVFLMILSTFFVLKENDDTLNPYIANGTEKSVMVQAVNNFSKLMDGDISPQKISPDKQEIRDYIMSHSDMDPFIPYIENFELIGCAINEYQGEALTHLVYRNGDEIIYIYEVEQHAISNNSLDLPEPVNNTITAQKYYMCDNINDDNCVLLMWYVDNKICVSVSNLPKQQLVTKFASLN